MESKKKINLLKNFWSKKKVLITGHTGFKGSWLCILLKILNAEIHGISLKPKKKSLFNQTNIIQNLSSNTYLDINNLELLKKKLKKIKPEVIFHLAAQPLVLESYHDPVETFKTNIMGTVNLLEAIRFTKSIKSVVIITTDKVYKIGTKNKIYKEEDQLGGLDPYSASKVSVELIVKSYIKSFFDFSKLKNKISTARAGNVIGGGDYSKDRLLPDIIHSINNNKILKIRNPNHIRPWQHVIEPLAGYLMLAEKQYKTDKNTIHAWNFGPYYKNFKKVSYILKTMSSLKKFNVKILKKVKKKESKVLKLNSLKAQKILKWKPKWNLERTLHYIFDWNKNVRNGKSAKQTCEDQILMYLKKH